MTINFADDVPEQIQITDDNVKQIATLAEKQLNIESHIANAEENLKELRKELSKVAEEDLPNAMLEAGVSEFKLATGEMITIKADIYPSIPAKNKLLAFDWLRKNNHGSLIKNNVTVQFGKDEDQRALNLLATLTGDGFNPTQKESVHAGTLKAFVKEQMADPDTPDLPEDLFTVFEKSKSIVKLS